MDANSLEVKERVLRVPTAALMEGPRVLVVGDDLRLVSRDVAVGSSNWDYTEIRTGLAPGDRVVVSLDRAEVEPGANVVVEADGSRRRPRADLTARRTSWRKPGTTGPWGSIRIMVSITAIAGISSISAKSAISWLALIASR